MTGPRFPWSALTGHGTQAEIARASGYDSSAMSRYARDGLTLAAADRVAVGLGLHPAMIWPDEWHKLATRECAAPDCSERFIPPVKAPWQKWHHPRCAARTRRRERYRTDPVFAAKVQAERRAYYEECADYERRTSAERARRRRERAA